MIKGNKIYVQEMSGGEVGVSVNGDAVTENEIVIDKVEGVKKIFEINGGSNNSFSVRSAVNCGQIGSLNHRGSQEVLDQLIERISRIEANISADERILLQSSLQKAQDDNSKSGWYVFLDIVEKIFSSTASVMDLVDEFKKYIG